MKRLIVFAVAFNVAVLLSATAATAAVWRFCPQPLPPVATLLITAATAGVFFCSVLQLIKARLDP